MEFYSGDLQRLVNEILAPRYKNIWLVGGAMLGQSFLRLGLVDEIRLMIAPVTLGGRTAPVRRFRRRAEVASEERSRLQERLC